MPQTLLEAMACGRPHVLPPLPRYAELVEHEREVLLAAPTAAGMGKALARLRSEPALLRRLGEEARATIVREADRDRELATMESVYHDLIAARRRSPLPYRLGYLSRLLVEHLSPVQKI